MDVVLTLYLNQTLLSSTITFENVHFVRCLSALIVSINTVCDEAEANKLYNVKSCYFKMVTVAGSRL